MKDLLFKLKISQDNYCSFCKTEEETITHIFCHCKCIGRIWSWLERWLFDKTGQHIVFTDQRKIFGFKGSNNSALNCILIILRQEIYSAKLRTNIPSIQMIKHAIQEYYKKEQFIARVQYRETQFHKKWFILQNIV